MPLSDNEIFERCQSDTLSRQMIEPFKSRQQTKTDFGDPCISYGLSSYGYDIRVGGNFKVFTNVFGGIIDPKNVEPNIFVDRTIGTGTIQNGRNYIDIPANSFALAASFEQFVIPRDILVICLGKSTYARCGIITNVTPLEPEWEGFITLEISNTTPVPARIYAYEGICQLIFLRADEICRDSYADKKGKYQGQDQEVTLPKV